MNEIIELLKIATPTMIIFGKLLFDNKRKSKKELESSKLFENEKTLQKKEHAAIDRKLSDLILKIKGVEVTNSRIENDVKELSVLSKNTDFSRKLKTKLESHLSYIIAEFPKEQKEILHTALLQGFKVIQYILDEDFHNIEKDLIYKKLEHSAKFTKSTMNIADEKFIKIENQVKAIFRAYSAKVEAMSIIESNGQRRNSFTELNINLIDDIISVF